MASPFTVEVQGLFNLLKQLDEKSKSLTVDVDRSLAVGCQSIATEAKMKVPKDMGGLSSTIGSMKIGDLTYEVAAQSGYAAYVEFGTGAKAVIPKGFEAYASQFHQKGNGNFKDFVNKLTEWVKRKQLVGTYSVKTHKRTDTGKLRSSQDSQARSIAYLIARHILKYGGKPQPFLFPAFNKIFPVIKEDIKQVLSK
jgi:hypothetical protein